MFWPRSASGLFLTGVSYALMKVNDEVSVGRTRLILPKWKISSADQERLAYIQEAIGSNPISSTWISFERTNWKRRERFKRNVISSLIRNIAMGNLET